MAKKPQDAATSGNKSQMPIYVYPKGGIYVEPKDVLANQEFQRQVRLMAKIRVNGRASKLRP